jgi:hypothetical protein
VPLAVPVAVTPAAATATPSAALPSAAAPTTAPLFRPVAALAVDRPIPAGFEGHRRRLPTAGTDNGRARAHAGSARAVAAAVVLGMGRSVAAAASSALLGLATRFTPPGRGVSTFLEKLLFTSSEHKFLTAVATSK